MRRCIICNQECKNNAKYCAKCGKLLRKNWGLAINIKKTMGIKVCPMCFSHVISSGEVFCSDCRRFLKVKKKVFRKSKYINSWNELSKKMRKSGIAGI